MKATWDETWMNVASTIALRSECVRAQAGAVIVSSTQRMVATGYNGPPALFPRSFKSTGTTCKDYCNRASEMQPLMSCYRDCVSVHAEANALLFCDRDVRVGGSLYVTTNVCWDCAKLVANSGIACVVMRVDAQHRDPEDVISFLGKCHVQVRTWEL